MKNKAFTLAETLIVIGIIGVVAALTLPNLNHATGDKEKVTRVKKIYSSLTDAVDRAQVIYGPFDTWFKDLDEEDNAGAAERFAKRVTEFLKVSKDCGVNEGCISTAPLLMQPQVEDEGSNVRDENYYEALKDYSYMVLLSDGMSLAFRGWWKVTVDIDGPTKGKNQIGNDIFDFTIMNDSGYTCSNQLVPSSCETLEENTRDTEDFYYGNTNGSNVTAWVIENGNLDYLKCPDELNWETQTSCK